MARTDPVPREPGTRPGSMRGGNLIHEEPLRRVFEKLLGATSATSMCSSLHLSIVQYNVTASRQSLLHETKSEEARPLEKGARKPARCNQKRSEVLRSRKIARAPRLKPNSQRKQFKQTSSRILCTPFFPGCLRAHAACVSIRTTE